MLHTGLNAWGDHRINKGSKPEIPNWVSPDKSTLILLFTPTACESWHSGETAQKLIQRKVSWKAHERRTHQQQHMTNDSSWAARDQATNSSKNLQEKLTSEILLMVKFSVWIIDGIFGRKLSRSVASWMALIDQFWETGGAGELREKNSLKPFTRFWQLPAKQHKFSVSVKPCAHSFLCACEKQAGRGNTR